MSNNTPIVGVGVVFEFATVSSPTIFTVLNGVDSISFSGDKIATEKTTTMATAGGVDTYITSTQEPWKRRRKSFLVSRRYHAGRSGHYPRRGCWGPDEGNLRLRQRKQPRFLGHRGEHVRHSLAGQARTLGRQDQAQWSLDPGLKTRACRAVERNSFPGFTHAQGVSICQTNSLLKTAS